MCIDVFSLQSPITAHSEAAFSCTSGRLRQLSPNEHARHTQFSPLVRRTQRKLAAPKIARSTGGSKLNSANPLNDLIQMTSSTIKHMDLGHKPNNSKYQVCIVELKVASCCSRSMLLRQNHGGHEMFNERSHFSHFYRTSFSSISMGKNTFSIL